MHGSQIEDLFTNSKKLSREKFYINWKVQWISNLYLFIYLLHSPNPSWVLGEWLKASHENMQSRSNLWGTYCNCLFTTKMKLVLSSSRIHVNIWQSVEPNLSMYYIFVVPNVLEHIIKIIAFFNIIKFNWYIYN